MSYIISTRNLTKVFNGKEVVSDVSMNISQGQIYGFLGPNGAGKTTVMRMILNLVKPTSGEIELFGEMLKPSSVEMFKRIGSIIEYPIFYDKLTAKENLEIHCEYMGLYNKKAISDALELVKLTGADKKAVAEFSLGMKQRLGMARALVTKPELLILDEPINGLDPAGIKDFRDLFHMLSKEYNMTLFISSHLLSEIEQVADTIGIIQNGVLKEEASMNDLKTRNLGFIEIVTPDCRKAVFVLENSLNIHNFKVIGDDTIRIYQSDVSQPEISKTLILNDVTIESIHHKRTSLEEYFIDQTGGGEKYA
ncbi:ABC-2 type transport system ATP-binding protein [Paenibacillus uliginis N3/975]|uniref:ABC-2 type transport system ATP-binding protein n=1 Tax=Paenibacillus uliginis N3/975 TaxID=1313296 RepID=A0A1X7HR11_9BACL|nr:MULTISPECIES: ATP-binding cassette domain-containing protein [Paenibacillus]UNK19038.1 ATP-binding cassette domain-containing protein [Paenibacillus sp. N3/727]SMF91345.1 ABC-2 type transport system ATP-binding protein [Paenibacillus uliginis N3/975]